MKMDTLTPSKPVNADFVYLNLVREILTVGELRPNRTGTDTLAVFGRQLRFDLRNGFPLLTTKKVHTRSIIQELLWFLKGDNRLSTLREQGVSIWDEWARDDDTIGRGYGVQWRDWKSADFDGVANGKPPIGHHTVDQLKDLVSGLRNNPMSRRHIVTAWNPGELQYMALPPCHMMFQCHVHPAKEEGGRLGLSLQMYQRSADIGLGVPFNIASYALLLLILAHCCDMEPREFIHDFGDVHVYVNHIDQLREQLCRDPWKHVSPVVYLNKSKTEPDQMKYEDITIVGYEHHPAISMPVAV